MSSEKSRSHGHESHKHGEIDPKQAHEQQEALKQRIENAAEQAHRHSKEDLEHITHKAEKHADSTEEVRHRLERASTTQKAHHPEKGKAPPLDRVIIRARQHLSPTDQKVSKVIHNKAVENVSYVAGATVARPSGIFYGALFSFLATLIFFVVSKIYGYEYNAFIGIAAFGGGFVLGLFVEFATRKFKPEKKQKNI